MKSHSRPSKIACLLLLIVWLASACNTGELPTYVPTLTATDTPTITPSPIPATATPTPTPTDTPTPTPTATPTPTPIPAPPLPGSVLLVSIDGLRPDVVQLTNTPYLDWLVERGAVSWGAQTILPSVTLPGHASMICGTAPGTHQVLWNEYEPDLGYVPLPSLFSVAHDAGLSTAMFVGKAKLEHLAVPGTVDIYAHVTGGDAQVAAQASDYLRTATPGVLFVHLTDVDTIGHIHGWLSSPQLDYVTRADAALGIILNTLDTLGRLESTLVIVTSDHGGIGLVHGGNEPESMTIPWLISGPGVYVDHELQSAVVIYDTASTAAWALGLPLPDEWEGRPILEAFGP